MSLIRDAERHPVTTILVVGAIAAVLAEASGRSIDHMVLTPWTAREEPWRYLTTIFPHGGALHLLFNLYWTVRLGSQIEERLGMGRMVALTVLSTVVAGGCEVLLYNSGIGLSGAVYAFAFFAWSRGRHDPRFQGVLSRQDLNLFVIWFFFCIVATETGFMHIANAAHGGGALIGYLLGMRKPWLAPIFVVVIAAASLFRVDLAIGAADVRDLRHQAVEALLDKDLETAISRYDELFEQGGNQAGDWYNYGLAMLWSGRDDEAYTAMIRAMEIDPQIITDMDLREDVLRVRAQRRTEGR